jgi:predicted AAA+ superfamily ATPase
MRKSSGVHSGASWEGLVIETLIGAAPEATVASFYRSSAGAEIDLPLGLPNGQVWAIEIKRSLVPRVAKGFHVACEDLKPDRKCVVYAGSEGFPLGHGIEAVGARGLAEELALMR